MPGGNSARPNGQDSKTGDSGVRKGRGNGLGSGFAQGPGGECLCSNCGHRETHQIGVPCYNKKCPKCGSPMTRA